jgi:type IV secretory pathway VirB2 component (pilin)
MADLASRSGGPPSRRNREQRAYRMVVTGGVAGVVAVVGVVLAIAGVLGWWIPFLAVIVAVVCALRFRSIVSP